MGLGISIFSRLSLSISIAIFFKSVDISTINISYRYIEQGYSGIREAGASPLVLMSMLFMLLTQAAGKLILQLILLGLTEV